MNPKLLTKFEADLEGVARNTAAGIAFVTNLSPASRRELQERARAKGAVADVFHLERVRALLDSPRGYGIRLQYLGIGMTLEDQTAFFAERDGRIEERLDRLERMMTTVSEQVAGTPVEPIRVTMAAGSTTPTRSLLSSMHIAAVANERLGPGRFRTVQNWIGSTMKDDATFIPPPPEAVPGCVDEMLGAYSERLGAHSPTMGLQEATEHVAWLYARFLSIHPFLDGNGKVARALAQYELGRLCGAYLKTAFLETPEHFRSLAAATRGDLSGVLSDFRRAVWSEAGDAAQQQHAANDALRRR